ncbi:phage late control D family protein [Bacillus horti]|uniref:Phage protein D n=1 Tax=Caldalkalibacillus horti TaxID=77523 RepID=A0ABT9W0D3_9BACI|nr:hypothetical protein [Bacillus horti]MDQ0166564.1 phage protein D [Bacillus horti]
MSNLKLSTKTYSFQQLEEKYRGFLAPAFQILVEGSNIQLEGMVLSNVKVSTSIQATADTFSFTVSNAFDFGKREFDSSWINKYFSPTKSVEIKMGYVDRFETVMEGIITKISYEYPKNGHPSIHVTGMDLSFLMMRGKKIKSWSDKSYSEIVTEIGGDYSLKLDVDSCPKTNSHHVQNFKDNFNFIKGLAKEVNYDFSIVGRTLYFKKPLTQAASVIELEWGKHLHSFSATHDISQQVSKVHVYGTNHKSKEVYSGEAAQINKLGSNAKTGADLMRSFGTNADDYNKEELQSAEEAKLRAEAILNETAMNLVQGNGECIGLPEIQAGRYLKLAKLGRHLSQPYHILTVTHSIGKTGYTTSFTFRGNAI